MSNLNTYQPAEVEARWQWTWERDDVFRTPEPENGGRPAFVYAAPPFTTGNLHMGHVRSYSIADACARYRRARGDDVLFSIGFDSFGLPNELAAEAAGIPAHEWAERCRASMIGQLKRLGFSIDWSRTFDSSDDTIFRWTQWLFLRFFERGLLFKAEATEHWCERCDTALASMQVVDGRCWRCAEASTYGRVSQWYLNMEPYHAELHAGLTRLDGWDFTMIENQRSLLGRLEGVELVLESSEGDSLTVFSEHPGRLDEATFVALSPMHPEVDLWARGAAHGVEASHTRRQTGVGRKTDSMALLKTDRSVGVPGSPVVLPVVVTPSVDARIVGSAVLGIPACNRMDAAIAKRLGLPQVPGISPGLKAHRRDVVRFRCRNFSVSRTRSWATPIPVVNCRECGPVPVNDQELPVRLQERSLSQAGHASATAPAQVRPCPRCGVDARPDSETLDCHMDAIWALVPLAVPPDARATAMFVHPELRRWLPAAQIICGSDQAKYMLSYRYFFKAIADCGYLGHVPGGEPAVRLLMHGMVLSGGRKMSKHLGNTVVPDDLVHAWGADTVRLALLGAARPSKDFNWTEQGLRFARVFLEELWAFALELPGWITAAVHEADEAPREVRRTRKLNIRHRAAVDRITRDFERLRYDSAIDNLCSFFERIRDFVKRRALNGKELDQVDAQAVGVALRSLLRMLEPLAPHFASELWSRLGGQTDLRSVAWPRIEVAEIRDPSSFAS